MEKEILIRGGEVEGDYGTVTLNPLPAAWIQWPIACACFDGENNLYQFFDFREKGSVYIIDVFASGNFSVNEPASVNEEKLGGLWY